MTESKFVATYDALAADVVDAGAGRPASLIVVAAGRQRVIIRMERYAIMQLRARIEAILQRTSSSHPSRPVA